MSCEVGIGAGRRAPKSSRTGWATIRSSLWRVSPSAPADIDWSRLRLARSPKLCSAGSRKSRACRSPCTSRMRPWRRPLPTWESQSSAAVRTVAEALVALGGNLGDVRDTIDRAVATFCDDRGVRLIARSSDYRTLPWGVKDQPVFVNACIAVETRLPPRALLARAQAVERTLGRERSKERRWGPRQIDIDLIAYEDVALEAPDLTLPHPQLFTRAFVLVPLAEIAPERLIAGPRVRDALAQLDTSGVQKLA